MTCEETTQPQGHTTKQQRHANTAPALQWAVQGVSPSVCCWPARATRLVQHTPKVLCVHQHRTHPCPDTLHSNCSTVQSLHTFHTTAGQSTMSKTQGHADRKGMLDPADAASTTRPGAGRTPRIASGAQPLTTCQPRPRPAHKPCHCHSGHAAAFAGPNLLKPKHKPNLLHPTAHGLQRCHHVHPW